jgi:hypothetical protein
MKPSKYFETIPCLAIFKIYFLDGFFKDFLITAKASSAESTSWNISKSLFWIAPYLV